MRIWKQQSQNQWTGSSSYQQHTGGIYCMILNQNEDQLFTGGNDNTIKVWSVDFLMNKLLYLYSLEKHNNFVSGLSLNESESILVLCANNEDQIIIWERAQGNRMKFKNVVKQSTKYSGSTLKFILENQFVLITNSSNINLLIVFEIKKGVFQEIQEKNIQLNSNNQLTDKFLFPLVNTKQKNLIIVRHKTCIYLIKKLNNGNFKIIEQININTCNIYGTITNNGQNLIYWDDKKKRLFTI